MTEEYPFHEQFESVGEPVAPEIGCMAALLDLAQVQPYGRFQAVSGFFEAFAQMPAPADLRTSIAVLTPGRDDGLGTSTIVVPGTEAVAYLVIGFSPRDCGTDTLLNLDVVNTAEGLKILRKEWDNGPVPRYTRALTDTEVDALRQDAQATRQIVVETAMELMKLGPLVEEAGPDGTRRFHVGDILSVLTERLVSARGLEGVSDLLGYMTNDDPYITQLGRFREECIASLKEQVRESLSPFYEEMPEDLKSAVDGYKWLAKVAESIGTSMLPVRPIDPSQHAIMDHLDELELDYGPEIRDKIIFIDPYNEADPDSQED